MDAVSLGVDIISTPLPTILTKNGQALSLPLTLSQPFSSSINKTQEGGGGVGVGENESIKVSHQIMNLRDAKYRRDSTPMVESFVISSVLTVCFFILPYACV